MSQKQALKDEDIATTWMRGGGGTRMAFEADPDKTDPDGSDADGTDSDAADPDSDATDSDSDAQDN
jgi:hypothetical protein